MSPFNSAQLAGEQFIHETEDFGVEIGKLRSEGDFKGLTGYLVVNKRTMVVEGEMTVEFAAIRTMRDLQIQLEAALENKEASEVEVVTEDMDFDTMLQRLAEKQDQTE